MSNNNEIIEVETIGDKAKNQEDITPSDYFNHVKGMKQQYDIESAEIIINQALKMIDRCKITKQTDMAKLIAHEAELALKEINVANQGFDIYVNRKDIEKYINDVEGKAVKLIELSKYTREIPDEAIDKVSKATELFDELYIIFTDYTMKESKKVAKERRSKDPVIFGAFKDNTGSDIYVEDKLFFIADWVEDKCELTLQEIVRDVANRENREITYKITTPEGEEAVKEYLRSFSEPIGEVIKPVSIFKKAKNAVKKPRGTTKKSTKKNVEE